jgi:hypothetical protein
MKAVDTDGNGRISYNGELADYRAQCCSVLERS